MVMAVLGCSGVTPEPTAQDLAEQLGSKDAAVVAAAMGAARAWIEAEPAAGMAYVQGYWLKPLVEGRRFGEAEELCVRAMAAWPMDVGRVEALQRQRVQLRLDQRRFDEALAQARVLFDVSSMAGTEAALLMVAACVNAVHGNDAGTMERFVAEQRAGAGGTMEKPVTSPMMLSFRADSTTAEAWNGAIAGLKGPTGGLPASVPDLLAVGNLELLAGRPGRAKAAFLRMQMAAEAENLRLANEAVARAMKAEDGSVGRANGYAVSLRPR